jgi:uncharacterized protein YdhG (YjbR/CyaY superfamily)
MAKARSKPTEAEQVNDWMDKLDASFKPSINAVRKIIRTAAAKLTERIKWNAPSYYYKEDIVTFGPTKVKDKIILVFHHPGIVKIRSELLQGTYKDRRLVYLNSIKEIKVAQKELERIIKESVAMIDK